MRNMLTKKKNAIFGRYPCCDLVNNAIRFILKGEYDLAISELVCAIHEANGYIHEDVSKEANEANYRVWQHRKGIE